MLLPYVASTPVIQTGTRAASFCLLCLVRCSLAKIKHIPVIRLAGWLKHCNLSLSHEEAVAEPDCHETFGHHCSAHRCC